VTTRDRTVVVIVAVLALLGGAWLIVIQPKRNQAAALGKQIQNAQAQLSSARAELAQNQTARTEFASDYASLIRLGEAVPADDNVPSLIYQLQAAAGDAHVDFRSLQLNASGSGSATPAAPPAGASSGGSAAAATAASTQLPPGAAVGPAGFPTEQFSFVFRGNFFHLANFLRRVQRFVVAGNSSVAVSGRLMTLNAISLGPGPSGFPQISASISATTYLVPFGQGTLNGATPAGPSSAAAQAVSTPPSSSSAAPAVVTLPAR
jgi:type II secretory pathway pseudopilin PulG